MTNNRFDCELLVTNASVVRRKTYVIVWLEGVYKHPCFVLHTVAKRFFDDGNAPLIEKVEVLRPGDTVDVTIELVTRRTRDNLSYLAFDLVDINN